MQGARRGVSSGQIRDLVEKPTNYAFDRRISNILEGTDSCCADTTRRLK
jgi:hypothetical protein